MNPYFVNKYGIQISSKQYEENGYGLDLILSMLSHRLSVSYPTRSGVELKVIV